PKKLGHGRDEDHQARKRVRKPLLERHEHPVAERSRNEARLRIAELAHKHVKVQSLWRIARVSNSQRARMAAGVGAHHASERRSSRLWAWSTTRRASCRSRFDSGHGTALADGDGTSRGSRPPNPPA